MKILFNTPTTQLMATDNEEFNFLSKECVPKEFRRHFVILIKRIDEVLHHYIVGQIIVCLILGTFYSLLLFCIGFNYSFVVGLIAGFLTLLPYFGAFCGGGIALVLGYLQFGFSLSKLFAILFIFCLGQFLEGNFVTPNLIGNKIKVYGKVFVYQKLFLYHYLLFLQNYNKLTCHL